MRALIGLGGLALLLGFVGCTPQGETAALDEAAVQAATDAIEAIRRQEAALIGAGDVEGLLALYTEDVVLMPPNEPAVLGRDAHRSWLEETFAQTTLEITPSPGGEVVVMGDWAFERYTLDMVATPAEGGEAIRDRGHCIHLYQRQADGSWKIARDIWNSDSPLPES